MTLRAAPCLLVLALSSAALAVTDKEVSCRVSDRGKISTFSNDKVYIQIPCKYQATTFECQGYKVHVSPGMALDSKARYFTDTMWVSFTSMTSLDVWKGRTSTGRIQRHFNDSASTSAFKTKEEVSDDGMEVTKDSDEQQFSATVGVRGTDIAVTFYAYDEKVKNRRKRNGFEISCTGAKFDAQGDYPQSVCGNSTHKKAIRKQQKALDMGTRTDTIIHDVLDKGLDAQTKPQCQIASLVFEECGALRQQAVRQCSPILTKPYIRKCLRKAYKDPMDVFIFCLRKACGLEAEACFNFNEAMEGCPKNKNLPLEPCVAPAAP